MKKVIIMACAALAACMAYSALDLFTGTKGIPLHNGTSINSGASNTVVVAKGPAHGIGAVYVLDGGCLGRTKLRVTLYATNKVETGWTPYAETDFTETNNCVRAVKFTAEYLPEDIKVTVQSVGGATKVSSFILTY